MSNGGKVWYLYTCMGSGRWEKRATYKSEAEARLAQQHQERAAQSYQENLKELGRVGTYLYLIIEMDADSEPPSSEEVKSLADEEVRNKADNFTKFLYFNRQ